MGKIKLSGTSEWFTPDIEVPTADGKRMRNRDLPFEDQIRVEYTHATVADRAQYIYEETDAKTQRSRLCFDPVALVRKHCKALKGLEDYGIKDGPTLVDFPPTPETNEIIMAIFRRVLGVDEDEEQEEQ